MTESRVFRENRVRQNRGKLQPGRHNRVQLVSKIWVRFTAGHVNGLNLRLLLALGRLAEIGLLALFVLPIRARIDVVLVGLPAILGFPAGVIRERLRGCGFDGLSFRSGLTGLKGGFQRFELGLVPIGFPFSFTSRSHVAFAMFCRSSF